MSEVPVHRQDEGKGGGEGTPTPESRLPLQSPWSREPLARGVRAEAGTSGVPDPGPVPAASGPPLRCYNCGELGHLTQKCDHYGPYNLEPGKNREDYAELIQEIADRHAADIIREHEH